MEEKPPDAINLLTKTTFKDILISADNDDIIIPISSTYDKAVVHIGIGSKSGIIIEKSNGEDMTTSVRYATRKFSEYRYKKGNKDHGVTDSKGEDYWKAKIEIGEKVSNDLQNDGEIARHLLQLNSYKVPFEIRKATRSLSESDILGQTKSRNDKDDIDQTKTTTVTKSSTDVTDVSQLEFRYEKKSAEVPKVGTVVDSELLGNKNVNSDIVVDKLIKTMFEAFIAKSSVKHACDAIDKAYEKEMLAIAIGKEDAVRQPNEKWSPDKTRSYLTTTNDIYQDEGSVMLKRGSLRFAECTSSKTLDKRKSFHEKLLQNQSSTESDTGTDMKSDVSSLKSQLFSPIEKFAMLTRESECNLTEMAMKDQVNISEVVAIEAEDNNGCSDLDGLERLNTDMVQSESGTSEQLYSEVTQCGAMICHEREQDSNPSDTIVDKRSPDNVSHSNPCDAIVDKRSLDTLLKSHSSDIIVDKRSLDTVSNSDLPDVNVDKRSHDTVSNSDPSDVIVDKRSLDTISYSKPPDAIGIKQSQDTSYNNPSNTIFALTMLTVLDTPSYSDPNDTIVDPGSLDAYSTSHSDISVAIFDNGSDDALSDSDTLDEIDDIEPDDINQDAVLDKDEIYKDEAAARCDIDNIADEDVTDDEDVTNNEDVTDDDGATDDDDNLFGIMNIYKESDLHYDLNHTPAAENCAEKKDFGYKFFSLSTFFSN